MTSRSYLRGPELRPNCAACLVIIPHGDRHCADCKPAPATPPAPPLERANPAVLRRMEDLGSGFTSALASAWMRADSGNSERLMGAFGDLYRRFA